MRRPLRRRGSTKGAESEAWRATFATPRHPAHLVEYVTMETFRRPGQALAIVRRTGHGHWDSVGRMLAVSDIDGTAVRPSSLSLRRRAYSVRRTLDYVQWIVGIIFCFSSKRNHQLKSDILYL